MILLIIKKGKQTYNINQQWNKKNKLDTMNG